MEQHRFITPFALCFLLMTSALFAGGQTEPSPGAVSAASEITVTDSRGAEIRLSAYPRKVISLGPNLTETVFALRRENLLIGRTDFCDYPETALEIPSVGTLMEPSLETIIGLEPDLVLASTHVSEETLDSLEKAAVPVALLYGPEDFSGLEEVVTGCGRLLDADEAASELMAEIRTRRDEVLETASGFPVRPRVYYALGFGDGGDWTAGGGTFIDAMITMAGGENIAGSLEGWSFSKEMLVQENPDIIVVGAGQKERFLTLPVYRDLNAARTGQVYEIDENTLVRQGPRLAEGLESLSLFYRTFLETL